jgi:putative transcriptional regulator
MRDELFKELQNSIKEGGQILRGKKKPGRVFNFNNPDLKQIRENLGLS